MNAKKIVIVGKGTAGSQAVTHYSRWATNCEIEWHYDPSIPAQSVGEGSLLSFPRNMFENFNFSHQDLAHIDGTFKSGIHKENWGKKNDSFFHAFPPPLVAYHFNAVKLQELIVQKMKGKVKIVERNVNNDDLDCDFIMDCSGKPQSYDDFLEPKYIPVNAVHVTQCYWDYPEFQFTLAIARPYGWVFGIPLQNRCSIGYMYNSNINSLSEVQEDVKEVLHSYNLTPSSDTNSFSFNNYKRKNNYTDRVAYSGNASFFLEPLEATSVGVMNHIQRNAYDVWSEKISYKEANRNYLRLLEQIERMIMMHYSVGSPFSTLFWDFAEQRGKACMEEATSDPSFQQMLNCTKTFSSLDTCYSQNATEEYGTWCAGSFFQNIAGLGVC